MLLTQMFSIFIIYIRSKIKPYIKKQMSNKTEYKTIKLFYIHMSKYKLFRNIPLRKTNKMLGKV